MPVVEERDCVVYWVCPTERLFGCEYGVFAWDAVSEMTYASLNNNACINSSFAENLSKAKTKACMSEDGQRVLMMHVACDLVDAAMYFEVMQRPYLGTLVQREGI